MIRTNVLSLKGTKFSEYVESPALLKAENVRKMAVHQPRFVKMCRHVFTCWSNKACWNTVGVKVNHERRQSAQIPGKEVHEDVRDYSCERVVLHPHILLEDHRGFLFHFQIEFNVSPAGHFEVIVIL